MSDQSEQSELAHVRTDFAEDRTVLANERTFAGWMRSGLAAIGIALAFNALFGRLEPTWVPKSIATTFLAIAMLIFLGAERRACAVLAKLHAHNIVTVKLGYLRLVTILTVAATAALIPAIWLLLG